MSTFETINIDQSNNDSLNERYKVRSICLSDPLIQNDNYRNKKKGKIPISVICFFLFINIITSFGYFTYSISNY